MLGPSGPRRLRLAIEHLAQHRGGICFAVDLDPRWVIKLIKKGSSEQMQAYKDHVIEQAVTILNAGHDIRCMFTTPKLLEALANRLDVLGTSIRKAGITGIFSGGTEFTPQWNRFAHEELLDGAYMTPTYGNTLMGLAASAPTGPHNNYKITYYAPQPRAVLQVVDFDDPNKVVEYGQTGRVKLTTLTKEFFMPGFLERDEGEREPPVRAVSVGRRQRRPSVPRLRGDDDGGRVLKSFKVYVRTQVLTAGFELDLNADEPGTLEFRTLELMLHLPVLRWGQPYTSMDVDDVVHFATGEPIAKVSRANGGMIQRDMRKAQRARDVLREIPIDELITRVGTAGDLYANATLPMGDGTQNPDEFVRAQSASTGLPERLCRGEHEEEHLRPERDAAHPDVADARPGPGGALARIRRRARRADQLSGAEPGPRPRPALELAGGPHPLAADHPDADRPRAEARARRSRGRRTGWRKRSSRPASRAKRSRCIPGEATSAPRCSRAARRSLIFGGTATVDRYRGNARVQAHGPGFSKIIFGDDQVDDWEKYLDVMVDSVFANSGRGCINCSGIWASRHTREIADALARRLAEVRPLPPDHPDASLAAFTIPGAADAISGSIDADLRAPGVADVTATHRQEPRVVKEGSADYLLPTVVHCASPEAEIAKKEYMFPFVTVVECPEAKMLEAIGPTLVCSAITDKPELRRKLIDAVHIDRLNLGPVPTIQLNWLQPHEGNIVDFLFRARAFQTA